MHTGLSIHVYMYTGAYVCVVYVCVSVCTYICMNIYIDKPVIEITATGRCGHVDVSWTSTNNDDVCSPVQYNVTLSSSSSTMDVIISNSSINTHRFTVLPNNTRFNITVIGINLMGIASEPASASVEMCMLFGT